MLRSKPRSGPVVDFAQRSHNSSIFTRTISASSRFCRGDALTSQIDSKALVSLPRQSSKTKHFSQEEEGELREMRERLSNTDIDKMAQQVEQEDYRALKSDLSSAQEELKAKDKIIKSLRMEVERGRGLEAKLAERDVGLGRLREELSNAKLREGHARDLVADHRRRIHELDDEIENMRLSESKVFDLLASQTKKFEESKIELEESKLEMAALLKKVEFLEASKNIHGSFDHREEDFHAAKDNWNQDEDEEEAGDIFVALKNELKQAIEAEERTRKAMDDLALALKEVATEAAEEKKKSSITELELSNLKEENERLKETLKSTEEKHQILLDEAKKQTELHINTIDRLTLEAEESLLAWNGREMGFVSCIKEAEEDNLRLTTALKEAEQSTMAAREETKQARDILKQAINEATAAKAAADIARVENSQLKDNIAEMEDALQFLSRENERLRINEADTNEKVEQHKQMMSSSLPPHHAKKHRRTTSKTTTTTTEDYCSDKSEDDEYAEARGGGAGEQKTAAGAAPKAQSDGGVNTEDDQDSDFEKSSHNRRRRGAIFRKVGDLILRRSFSISRKEPSPEPALIENNTSIVKT
nr:putative WEB family protein At1g65010, chloroplastic [Ipomoea trifida]